MASSIRGIEGKLAALLGLEEGGATAGWGGSIEAIQPTGPDFNGHRENAHIVTYITLILRILSQNPPFEN